MSAVIRELDVEAPMSELRAFPLILRPSDDQPSHITNASIIVIEACPQTQIIKIGRRSRIQKEFETLQRLGSEFSSSRLSPQTVVPTPVAKVDLKSTSLSAIRMSFHGYRILEMDQGNRKSIMNISRGILEDLQAMDIVWPSAAPKNITVEHNSGPVKYCAVDWELGFHRAKDARHSRRFYIRAMQLQEEWAQLYSSLLPYWSHGWPSPAELRSHWRPKSLYSDVDLSTVKSRRLECLATLCSLPTRLSDAAFFRCILVLKALCDTPPSGRALVVYAGDHISERGETRLRVLCSMLCFILKQERKTEALRNVRRLVITVGIQLQEWRKQEVQGTPFGATELVRASIRAFEASIDSIGNSALSHRWQELVALRCRKFILQGDDSDGDEWEVLITL